MSSYTESEERQTLRREVSKLASSYGREYFTRQARSGGKTTELWLAIGKAGYLGINIPEEYGGGGGGIGDVAAVCEELAAQGCPLLLMVVSPAICGTIISSGQPCAASSSQTAATSPMPPLPPPYSSGMLMPR